MDMFDNHSDFNKFMVHNGFAVNELSCSDYILARTIYRKLDLENAMTQTNCNPSIYGVARLVDNGSTDKLNWMLSKIEEGWNLFDFIEYNSRKNNANYGKFIQDVTEILDDKLFEKYTYVTLNMKDPDKTFKRIYRDYKFDQAVVVIKRFINIYWIRIWNGSYH